MSKKIFIKTFGCQMNEYDSNRIYDLLSSVGFQKVDTQKNADCYILNTCHIREKATEKVYSDIGRVKKDFRNKKKPIVIVTGCVAQAESEEMIKREPYIDIVMGPQSYHKINDVVLNHIRKNKKTILTEFDTVDKFDKLEEVISKNNKISSYITIQEGCDKFCNFCVVPYTRGPEFSRPFFQILKEAEILVKNGAKEIILIGQNVNAYHYTGNNKVYRISSLINELQKFKELKRIRFTTSHPKDMTDDLLECFQNCDKLMPLLHLPVQSGSNKILKLMNRKHTIEYYLSIINKLKKLNEKIIFSSDFIVGYPGESESDFEDTMNLVKSVEYINSYSFIFSPRPGTPATKFKIMDKKITNKRLNILQDLLKKIQLENNKKMLNKNFKVLVENRLKNQSKFFGRTEFSTPVIFESKTCIPGEIINVNIKSFNQNNLFGNQL